MRESLRKGKLRKQELALTKQKVALIQAADSIGKKIQYDCPGFLPNRRQVMFYMLLSLCLRLISFVHFIFLRLLWNPFSMVCYLFFVLIDIGKALVFTRNPVLDLIVATEYSVLEIQLLLAIL